MLYVLSVLVHSIRTRILNVHLDSESTIDRGFNDKGSNDASLGRWN
jgi:hypothetical protein